MVRVRQSLTEDNLCVTIVEPQQSVCGICGYVLMETEAILCECGAHRIVLPRCSNYSEHLLCHPGLLILVL